MLVAKREPISLQKKRSHCSILMKVCITISMKLYLSEVSCFIRLVIVLLRKPLLKWFTAWIKLNVSLKSSLNYKLLYRSLWQRNTNYRDCTICVVCTISRIAKLPITLINFNVVNFLNNILMTPYVDRRSYVMYY